MSALLVYFWLSACVCLQFLLCCLTIMTFTLAIKDELLNRLQLLLIVVMTTVMLKSSFNTHLPVIPYLTYVVRFLSHYVVI